MNDRHPESIIGMHMKDVPLPVGNTLTTGTLGSYRKSEIRSHHREDLSIVNKELST
jgi:hypothetical protein